MQHAVLEFQKNNKNKDTNKNIAYQYMSFPLLNTNYLLRRFVIIMLNQ
jgi:hypothetical protein